VSTNTYNILLKDIRVIYFLIATFSSHPFIRLYTKTEGFDEKKKRLFSRIFMTAVLMCVLLDCKRDLSCRFYTVKIYYTTAKRFVFISIKPFR